MSVAEHAGILLVIDGNVNFIFPDFQPAVDGMMASVRLLEFLAVRGLRMSEVVAYLPPTHLAREVAICPWGAKGKVMRLLNEHYRGSHVDKIDGMKIHLNDIEWVHILPNPDLPHFAITAEAVDTARAAELATAFRREIEGYIDAE
jgi:mannose-1-phosphate guanylyltransferase/phosphomannomutase